MVMPGVFHVEILNTEFMCRNAYIGRKYGHYSDTHIVCRVSAVTATFPWIMGADPPPFAEVPGACGLPVPDSYRKHCLQ